MVHRTAPYRTAPHVYNAIFYIFFAPWLVWLLPACSRRSRLPATGDIRELIRSAGDFFSDAGDTGIFFGIVCSRRGFFALADRPHFTGGQGRYRYTCSNRYSYCCYLTLLILRTSYIPRELPINRCSRGNYSSTVVRRILEFLVLDKFCNVQQQHS